MLGSLAGAAASKKVTEAYKGKFRQLTLFQSVMVYIYLTVRLTNQAEMKVGHNDPIDFVLCEKTIAQRIKGTLGITG
jgi:hypothetical protein